MTTALFLMATILIFDTDSGFFADDGAALTMLVRSPLASSIRGITVVSGNVWAAKGIDYMRRNVQLLHRPDIPVYLGAQEPLVHTAAMAKKEGKVAFAGALGEAPVLATRTAKNAIDFIIDTIDGNPGKVTFMAIGPMTNLAISFRMRPDLAAKIGTLILMGGAVGVPGNATKKAEFNFWFDPEAAQAVLRSTIPKKIMIGLNLTDQAPIRKSDYEQIAAAKTPITDLYAEDLGNLYPAFNKNPNAIAYIWDALVSAYLIDPRVVTASQTMFLDVDSRFGKNYGAVIPLDRSVAPNATPVQVMKRLDRERAWRIYKTALTKQD